MANKLKVEDLRTQLAQRGLDTTGTKPSLVERLEEALRNEAKDTQSNAATDNKKRSRESENGDSSNLPEKVKAIETFRQMGIRQLREEATLRGVSASGSKKELLERLCADDSEKEPEEVTEDKEATGGSKKELLGRLCADDSQKEPEEVPEDKEEIKAVDTFREMGIGQLRKEATRRGISANGSKKELLERLCADDSQKEPEVVPEDKEVKAVERFREMGIVQLRKEATLRGISANGSKKELLDRLCADDSKESQEIPDDKEEVKAVERFREMGIGQLRKEATLRGISAAGSKKELLERLCADSEKVSQAILEDKKEVKKSVKEKLVTATKKGGAVLDQWLPDDIKSHYHVLQHGNEIYDAMLNQTNVGQNNNKFYVIQALEFDGGGKFMVYNRWGRVGVQGQDKLQGPYTSRDGAIQEFEAKFYAKTKNRWSDRENFACRPKCYTWLEMDYSETDKEVTAVQEKITDSIQPRETQLEPRIAKFISLICNISMMKQQMLEIGYNAEKLPLGKLSKSTILKGYDVLRRISGVINQPNRENLDQLSGEFYTVIPHDFGFRKMREFVIDTPFKLKAKLEMVEALGEIEVASKLLADDIDLEDPLYGHYNRLGCQLTPLEVDSEEFNLIKIYMQNTHAKTHSDYTVDIVQIFRVSRKGESEQFSKYCTTKNRMLLWHGSRLTNWMGILSQGLRIAPPEAPVTGYMFGKGVYFADMFSKSANYCYSSNATNTGVLLLCEVALGEMAELLTAKYDADKLPKGKLSTKGVGVTAPDPKQSEALEDGVVVPLGKPKKQASSKGDLLYNEYIVYNTQQIRMRYVVQVNFNFKRR